MTGQGDRYSLRDWEQWPLISGLWDSGMEELGEELRMRKWLVGKPFDGTLYG